MKIEIERKFRFRTLTLRLGARKVNEEESGSTKTKLHEEIGDRTALLLPRVVYEEEDERKKICAKRQT